MTAFPFCTLPLVSRIVNILYINYDFPPMSGPAVWRALWFVRHLSGPFRFTVLCGDRSVWHDRYDASLVAEIPDGAKVVRLRARFVEDVTGRADRVLNRKWLRPIHALYRGLAWRFRALYPEANFWWLIKACVRGVVLTRSGRFDCVITSGPPHITHLVGLAIKRAWGTRWIMDYRDLWTDDPMQLPSGGYQRHLFPRLERACVRRADVIVTVSPYWLKVLTENNREWKEPGAFSLIRNGHNVDEGRSEPARQDASRRLTIHYNGTPQYFSETPHLFDALARLVAEAPAAEGPLLTFSGMSNTLREQIRRKNLEESVVDVGALRYVDGIERSRRADALLVLVNNDHTSRRGTIPAKTYEAIALHKHILAVVPLNSDVRELLGEYGNATICDVDDPEDISRGFRSLIARRFDGSLHGSKTPAETDAFANRFSRKELARQLADTLRALVPGGQGR